MNGVPAALREAVAAAREEVCRLHGALVDNGLVAWTSGNVVQEIVDWRESSSASVVSSPPGVALLCVWEVIASTIFGTSSSVFPFSRARRC